MSLRIRDHGSSADCVEHSRETSRITHPSVRLVVFVHQVVSAAPLCHLYGRSCVPLSGGPRDGSDSLTGQGATEALHRVRAIVVLSLSVWAAPPARQCVSEYIWTDEVQICKMQSIMMQFSPESNMDGSLCTKGQEKINTRAQEMLSR